MEIWWGFSPEHGWVALDRSIKCSAAGKLLFWRCSDGVVYPEDSWRWKKPRYVYAPSYINSLPVAKRNACEAELEALKSNWSREKAAQAAKAWEEHNAELASRTAAKNNSTKNTTVKVSHSDKYVSGFHFVCPREKGVTNNSDGTIWTGTWVVDKRLAQQSTKLGAYVALHAAKAEASYLQGVVKDYRTAPREQEYAEGQLVKIEYGIDFLLEPTNEPYQWHGEGSGEKGYLWSPIS